LYPSNLLNFLIGSLAAGPFIDGVDVTLVGSAQASGYGTLPPDPLVPPEPSQHGVAEQRTGHKCSGHRDSQRQHHPTHESGTLLAARSPIGGAPAFPPVFRPLAERGCVPDYG
jgi:hypothetical protein